MNSKVKNCMTIIFYIAALLFFGMEGNLPISPIIKIIINIALIILIVLVHIYDKRSDRPDKSGNGIFFNRVITVFFAIGVITALAIRFYF